MQAIKLYNFPRSGHAHRVELMLSAAITHRVDLR
jgi:hypothetical protein